MSAAAAPKFLEVRVSATAKAADALDAGEYQIQIFCKNCDVDQYAVLPKGRLANVLMREKCFSCGCSGELRKARDRYGVE